MKQLPPADPKLPALRALLGSDATDVLSAAGTAGGFEVVAAEASQVRYRPGRSVVVQYRTSIRDGNGQVSQPMLTATCGIDVGSDTPIVSGPEGVEIAVWRFPYDPFLPGLRSASNGPRVRELLQRLGAPTDTATLRVRAYRATRRAVVEARGDTASVFMKVLQPAKAHALHEKHQSLAKHLPIPRSLGWSQRLGIVAMEALPGTTLRNRIESGSAEMPSPAALIDLLDSFPQPSSTASATPPAHRRVREHARLIGSVLPEARVLLDELAAATDTASAPGPPEAVHGDFHASQVLLDGSEIVGLVDVDTAGSGQRVDDLAALVGQIATLTLLLPDPQPAQSYLEILIDDFDTRIDPEALRARTGYVILGLATGPFRVQLADWPHETMQRLELARRWVEAAASGEIPSYP